MAIAAVRATKLLDKNEFLLNFDLTFSLAFHPLRYPETIDRERRYAKADARPDAMPGVGGRTGRASSSGGVMADRRETRTVARGRSNAALGCAPRRGHRRAEYVEAAIAGTMRAATPTCAYRSVIGGGRNGALLEVGGPGPLGPTGRKGWIA
jgi:hypothetical protein